MKKLKNKKSCKPQAPSFKYPKGINWFKKKFDRDLKPQAPSTVDNGPGIMQDEFRKRYNMEYATKELERIADALEEILRLVKKDMAEMKKAAK